MRDPGRIDSPEPRERPKLTARGAVRGAVRFVLSLPVRLVKFILLLPVNVIKFIVLLPRRIFAAWRAGAKGLYTLRIKLWEGITASREGLRWLRLNAPRDVVGRALYFRLHPRRMQHGLCCLRRRLHGDVWSTKPGLAAIPKALTWARQYRRHKARFEAVEAMRSIIITNDTELDDRTDRPTIGLLARQRSIPRRWGGLLHGVILYGEIQRALELGSGFGISGLYIGRGLLDNYPIRTCMLISLDNDADSAQQARQAFYKLGFRDFALLREGGFKGELPDALEELAPVPFAFIDVLSDEDTLLPLFQQIKANAMPGALIIVNGIHHTPAMTRTWRAMQNMPRIAATVDLWRMGIVITGQGPPLRLCARL